MTIKRVSPKVLSFYLLVAFSGSEKTHKKCPYYFIMYGDLYMDGGMTGTSDKIAKNVKKIAKKH